MLFIIFLIHFLFTQFDIKPTITDFFKIDHVANIEYKYNFIYFYLFNTNNYP